MKRYIPNLLTLLNLAAGTAAVVLTLEGRWQLGVWLVLAGALLDFLDGLTARLLSAYSSIGRQLDSLADVVTFGVVPGVFVYTIFKSSFTGEFLATGGSLASGEFLATGESIASGGLLAAGGIGQWIILCSPVVIPLFAAIRLARFNLTEANEPFFRGLPAPAHALFWTGVFWQFIPGGLLYGSHIHIFYLWAVMWIMVLHMLLPVPMLTLKFSHFGYRGNVARYLFLAVAAVIIGLTGIGGLSIVVLAYILVSLLNFLWLTRVSK